MKLLDCASYDPAVAVTKATTGAAVMTAMDTTNLRCSFTVPASGMVQVRMKGTLHGATTAPQILLGVMNGAAIVKRCAPMLGGGNVAATTLLAAEVIFTVDGLTPGANLNWDAAWGVETGVASSAIKYGGPNDTTINNAFGAFCFEVWDCTTEGTAGATAADIWAAATRTLTSGANIALAKGTGLTGLNDIAAGAVRTELATELARIDAAISSRLATAGYTAPPAAAANATAVRTELGTELGRIDVAVSTRGTSTYAGGDTAGTTTLVGRLTAGRAAAIDNLDAAVSTRLSSAGYTVPDNAGITVAAVAAAAAASDAAAIKGKTDSLTFTVPGKLDVHTMTVNGTTVIGAGTEADPWRAEGS